MIDLSTLSPIEREVYSKLIEVKDPEFGVSIIERGLVDEVRVEEGSARIVYHLTVPFCPIPFALYIGREIRKRAREVAGVERVKVEVRDHLQADVINRILEREGG